MNRRTFFSGFLAVGSAIAAMPALARAKSKGRAVIALPENAAVGEYMMVCYAGGDKWLVIGQSSDRYEVKQL